MEELEQSNLYKTASHSQNLDFIYNQDLSSIENKDLIYILKLYLRLFKHKFFKFMKEKSKKNFKNILYITLDSPNYTPNSSRLDNPMEFISEYKKQYPNSDFKILVPIINANIEEKITKKINIDANGKTLSLENTGILFEFYLQNKIHSASLYKFPKNTFNIEVYGIYSKSFSHVKNTSELTKLQFLAPFIKSARLLIDKHIKKIFSPDIIHCENIPYFLGAEFEPNKISKTRTLQIIKDFTQIDTAKYEAFWAIINLADQKAMKKILNDEIIKKCLTKLFNLHNNKHFYQIKYYLNFIYKNYYKFRKFIDKGADLEENIIFNRLNARILQLFPNFSYNENLYYNPMIYTLIKTDFWATISNTYYNEIFENPKLTGKMFQFIENTKHKSAYLIQGFNLKKYPRENTRLIYHNFNTENFREFRIKNKKSLLKEFNADRIKTNFVDPTLFRGNEVKIYGNLDSFYDSPLLFANANQEIYANGIDILFNTILKLIELHKNVQIIISIKDGSKINYIKNWIDFVSKNKSFNGRWVFIDGEINLPKFVSASDMILIPRRANNLNPEHMIAMNYGCVPIVSRNGLLNDTIPDIFEDIANGCGLKTKTNLLIDNDPNDLFLSIVLKALNLYQNNPNSWNLIIKNCLNNDSKWTFSILEKYHYIYNEILNKHI